MSDVAGHVEEVHDYSLATLDSKEIFEQDKLAMRRDELQRHTSRWNKERGGEDGRQVDEEGEHVAAAAKGKYVKEGEEDVERKGKDEDAFFIISLLNMLSHCSTCYPSNDGVPVHNDILFIYLPIPKPFSD